MANVALRNVKKAYPNGFEAIKGIDFEVGDGQFCVLVGPSGCGKSTLLRMVAGLETITSGEIDIGGRVVNRIEPADRDIAMVFQNYALYPHMSVYNNMAYGLRNRGMAKGEIDTRVQEAARILELSSMLDRKPRAIVRRPAPARRHGPRHRAAAESVPVRRAALQPRCQAAHRHARRDPEIAAAAFTTSIYVTHDQLEAMTLADILVVMNGGQVEQIGNPLEIYQKPSTTFVAAFIGAPPMNLLSLRDSDIKLPGAGPEAGILGVRPEDLAIGNGAAPDGGIALDLTVEAIERVGAETYVYGIRSQQGHTPAVSSSPASCRPAKSWSAFPARKGPPSARKSGPWRRARSCICLPPTAGSGSIHRLVTGFSSDFRGA